MIISLVTTPVGSTNVPWLNFKEKLDFYVPNFQPDIPIVLK